MKIFTRNNQFTNFLAFAILAILINFFSAFKSGYATTFSSSVHLSGIVLLSGFIILERKGYEKTAMLLATIFFNAFFFTFTYYFGLRSLVFAYYFPFLVSFIYMFYGSASKREAKIFFLTCFAFITAIFLVCTMNGRQVLTEAQLAIMYQKNFLVSFALAAYYFYAVFSYLIVQKQAAEEASQSKARFLSIMSHELRTPLNGIIGTINLMKTAKENERERFQDILQSSSQHLLHLVNNVLDYSKASAGKMELNPVRCSLGETITNLCSVFQSQYDEKKLLLITDVDQALQKEVMLDDVRFVQVLTNLLSNALKYTEQGKVVLTAKCVQANGSGLMAEISVTDTGPGLSEAQQQQIFNSFNNIDNKTRKKESSGLGLSISKMIVELLGGQLLLDSKPGQGSRFYFTIPLPLSKATQTESEVMPNESISLRGAKVLIAEDNRINMMVAREFLKKWNIQLLEAENGLQAQQLLITNPDIDLLLLDLQMPEMNGYELNEWIQETQLGLPVIAFTAGIMTGEERQNLYNLGFMDMVPKPFAPADLEQKMKKALLKSRSRLLQEKS